MVVIRASVAAVRLECVEEAAGAMSASDRDESVIVGSVGLTTVDIKNRAAGQLLGQQGSEETARWLMVALLAQILESLHSDAISDVIDEIYLLPAIGGSEEYDRTTMEKLLIIKEVIVGWKGGNHEA